MKAEDTLSRKDVVLRRLAANGLAERFPDAVSCAGSLFGIQGQVQSYANLSLFSRVERLTMGKLSEAYSKRMLVNQWGQRKTLHIYDPKDSPAVCDLFNSSNYMDKLAKPDVREAVKVIISEEIQKNGSITRGRVKRLLNDRIPQSALKMDYRDYAVISWLSNNGVLLGEAGGPSVKDLFLPDYQWTKSEEQRERSLEDVLLRYFTCYGPATRQDFCHYSGLTLKETNRAFDSIKDRLNIDTYKGKPIYSAGPQKTAPARMLTVLGHYDPLLVAYADKDWLCGPEYKAKVWQTSGIVAGAILSGHRMLGIWKPQLNPETVSFIIEPFSDISEYEQRRIEKRMSQISKFLKKKMTEITYGEIPGPRIGPEE